MALALGLGSGLLSLLLPSTASAADAPGLAGSFFQMLGSLILVVGIILIICYLANRFLKTPGGNPFRYIRVVETRHLAPKKSLVLVEIGGEYLLLSNSGEGVTFIKQVDLVEEIEVVEDKNLANLIPAGVVEKLKQLSVPTRLPELCLQKKGGGFA